jgi:lysophospholipase L1-like esterase/pimeloyl-ACP methyl ester carboxylesterase
MGTTMTRNRILLLLTALTVYLLPDCGKSTVRIACVGNSITYGAGIMRRELNCYPAQLQALLGKGYEVRNFGKNGATLMRDGDIPYVEQEEYRQALEYLPHIVFIELGTNDSKLRNRNALPAFKSDYSELIQSFRRLASKPRVILLLPPPAFTSDTIGITDYIIVGRIIPAVQSAAYTSGCEVVNLYNYFLDRPACFPDQIHPSSIGAGLIAARLYEVAMFQELPSFDLLASAALTGARSSYYGFECCDFTFEGRAAKIVRPKKTLKGCPWLWRARFWGHEPQTEIALLERGFHLAFCDVAELFGNDEAIGIWNRFYDTLVGAGLSTKAALEGFSRGGVYMYRWAAANPTHVACVYADAPVLDLKSWPGGKGKGGGNPEEWERFKQDFNLASEEEALTFKGNPLDLAPQVAGAGFPMLHVCGDSDVVVPIEENTDLFEKRIVQAGGQITVIRKPGIGHHPHSLANPQPIVDFILRATGHKTNFARIAAPGNEYRESAGWKSGMEWHSLFDEMNRLGAHSPPADILFLGNSITQGIGGKGRSIVFAPGDSVFSAIFQKYAWLNFGLSADRTQHILWRVRGNWGKPKLIVLSVGVNNFPDDSGEEVAEGIAAIVKTIQKKDEAARILLAGPLPAKEKNSAFRKKFETVHRIISRLADNRRVFYSPLAFKMLRPDQSLDPALFASDGIHLSDKGYVALARLLAEDIATFRLLH